MIVAGVMSGTSADGINVALVRVAASRSAFPRFELLAHQESTYPSAVRRRILGSRNAASASVPDLARLGFLLGELYAGAVARAARQVKAKLELVGCHGQTLFHQGEPAPFLGRRISATWQAGEGAILAARLGVPVVCDFRPADMAAGGQGAPLVPFLDYALYRDAHVGRIVQNIGGIANLTAIPAEASPAQVIAFDTGPGNMVIDAVCERLFRRPYDRGGRIAVRGTVIEPLLHSALQHPFFRRKPPKTAGREEFGREFAERFMRRARGAHKEDVVALATALTARSIAQAVRRFVLPRGRFAEMIVSGGGARNPTLMRMLATELGSVRLRSSDDFGLPAEAKEAVAFALLAFQTWHRRSGNLPSATGASRPAILGKICYA